MLDDPYTDPQAVLDAIVTACDDGTVAVVESTLKGSDTPCRVLCAVLPSRHGDGGQDIFPLAVLFADNPFQVINPPGDAIEMQADHKAKH